MRQTLRFPRPATLFVTGGLALALAACGQEENQAPRLPTPVKAQIVAASQNVPSVALTGEIRARVQGDLAFRSTGRIAERFVDVGDHVEAGQVLATLESREQTADVASATAAVQSAEATLRQTTAAFDRQKALLASGFTTQTSYDNAQQALQAARATLDAAHSNLQTAQEQLTNAALTADASGIVVARNAEAGQVVEAAQAVFTVARDGARDAVFDIHEGLLARQPADDTVALALVSDPAVTATGKVREVAPAIDPTTGTVRVKITVETPPPAMTLGAAVTGIGRFQPNTVFVLPWGAFFTDKAGPAVWTVDPQSRTVALKPVVIDSYRTGAFLVKSGIEAGDVVITSGAQMLRPGQIVDPLMESAPTSKEATK
jgi:RND family efflux transporter MFP subunit